MFNNIFGSNLIHVANAYGREIFVGFTSSVLELTEAEVNIVIDIMKTSSINVNLKFGFNSTVLIGNRSYHQYRCRTSWEYMTVIADNGVVVCSNYQIAANRSFIVTKDGILPQKYGSDNLFEDTRGKENINLKKLNNINFSFNKFNLNNSSFIFEIFIKNTCK